MAWYWLVLISLAVIYAIIGIVLTALAFRDGERDWKELARTFLFFPGLLFLFIVGGIILNIGYRP